MILAAITGSVGCGKTTLAKIAKQLGYAVFDADGWVRGIYRDGEFLRRLAKVFPESVRDGAADKKYLRQVVFNDREQLGRLEAVVYPFLEDHLKKIIHKNAGKNYLYFLDAALLFEKGWDKYCDIIIVADVDYQIQKQRVMLRDRVSADDFERINSMQMKNKDKKLADIVINTDKGLNLLKSEMIAVIKELRGTDGQRNCI